MRSIAPITIGIFVSIILLSSQTFGDVAPDPGYKRISLKLILETNEDLADHQFFIKSGADIEEVFIKEGEETVISPLGGGAYYSSGQLLAVPRKELEKWNALPGDGRLSGLQKAVYDGRVPGTIELVNHIFSREVLATEASDYQDPVYRIERDPQAALKAVHLSGGANVSKPAAPPSSGLRFWRSAAAAVVAGIFLLFGITILGIMYFRKKAKAL
jgi:hypothetical protein